jgi:hypothetical protein
MTTNIIWRFLLEVFIIILPYILGMLVLMHQKKRNVRGGHPLWVTVIVAQIMAMVLDYYRNVPIIFYVTAFIWTIIMGLISEHYWYYDLSAVSIVSTAGAFCIYELYIRF